MSHENITDAEYQDFAFLWAHMGCDPLRVPPAEEMAAIPGESLAEEYAEAFVKSEWWKHRLQGLQIEFARRQNVLSVSNRK